MDHGTAERLRGQLVDRRARLREVVRGGGPVEDLVELLQRVDAALARMDADVFGECEVCHEAIDEPDILANPLVRYCLCRLNDRQLDVLQNDLDLAGRIQAGLLPPPDLDAAGWQAHYRYAPIGPVSGDTCDILAPENRPDEIFFSLGDVSGKGVAASLLMSHLNASFRSLVGLGLPVTELVARADRALLDTKLDTHYATLVAGIARRDGEIELCNAGHCPPLLVRRNGTHANGYRVERVDSTGFPLGMIPGQVPAAATRITLAPGDAIVLYSDGLPEAFNAEGEEYGIERVEAVLQERGGLPPRELAAEILTSQREFLHGAPREDDLTLLVLRRVAEPPGRS